MRQYLLLVGRAGGKADSMSILISVFFIMVAGMLQPLTHMSLYIQDRQFFLIDCADNLYSPLAYFISHTVVAIPIIIITGQVGSTCLLSAQAQPVRLLPVC